jgi:hypothetical protein
MTQFIQFSSIHVMSDELPCNLLCQTEFILQILMYSDLIMHVQSNILDKLVCGVIGILYVQLHRIISQVL